MPNQVKRFIGNWAVNNHKGLALFFRARYSPYRFSGGRIYLNLKESPMMLARALDLYEVNKMAAVRRFLKAGQTFIDVGGNKGDFALLAALVTGKTGKVLCFEPESSNCHWIRQSAQLNQYENLGLHEVALSDRDGTAQLHLGLQSGSHTLLSGQVGRDVGVSTVRTATLDSILETLSVTRVDVMKIDVEGAELSVLRGARQTLLASPGVVLLIDIHPFLGVEPAKVCSLLSEMGFSMYDMEPPFDKPVDLSGNLQELVAYRH
jgi:FkbM family methyltransferase